MKSVDRVCDVITAWQVLNCKQSNAPYFNLRDGFAITKNARTPSDSQWNVLYTTRYGATHPNSRVRFLPTVAPINTLPLRGAETTLKRDE